MNKKYIYSIIVSFLCVIGIVTYVYVVSDDSIKISQDCSIQGECNLNDNIKYVKEYGTNFTDEEIKYLLICTCLYSMIEEEDMKIIVKNFYKKKEAEPRIACGLFNKSIKNFIFDRTDGLKNVLKEDCIDHKYLRIYFNCFKSKEEVPPNVNDDNHYTKVACLFKTSRAVL